MRRRALTLSVGILLTALIAAIAVVSLVWLPTRSPTRRAAG